MDHMVATLATISIVVVSSVTAAIVSATIATRFMSHDIKKQFDDELSRRERMHDQRKRKLR